MPDFKLAWRLAPWALIGLLVIALLVVNTSRLSEANGRETAERERAEALALNKAQDTQIKRMEATAKANDALLQALSISVTAIAEDSDLTVEQTRQLRETNANVRTYLDTRLPPELAGVLNRRAAGTAPAGR